jgi:hypothetical protein
MQQPEHISPDQILQHVAESLDITPSDYQRAVNSYTAVGNWLKEGFSQNAYPGSQSEPEIYPQGSINLGTVVRPFRNGKEAEFDVDLVCQVQTPDTLIVPKTLKHQVGDRLKANGIYQDKLDDEGKRCWTLTYAASGGDPFHIDVLPCVPSLANFSAFYKGGIRITNRHKPTDTYEWRPSNPKGYAEWFRSKNTTFSHFAKQQRTSLFEASKAAGPGMRLFAAVEEIPDQLIRTPLQRAIQLLKRHRDIRFDKTPEIKPISIIITTVAAALYQGETDVYTSLINIVERLSLHKDLVENQNFAINARVAALKLITRTGDGKWWIPNPADPRENFADKWHEDNHARARAFFKWAQQVAEDVRNIPIGKGFPAVSAYMNPLFGERVTTAGIKRLGESFRASRESGTLKMQAGSGILGTVGGLGVRAHTFYGK